MTFITREDYFNSCVMIHKIPCRIIQSNSENAEVHEFPDFETALNYAKSSKLRVRCCPSCKPQLNAGVDLEKEETFQSTTENAEDKLINTILEMSNSAKLALILRELMILNGNLSGIESDIASIRVSLENIEEKNDDIADSIEDIKLNTEQMEDNISDIKTNTDSIDSQTFNIELNTKYRN